MKMIACPNCGMRVNADAAGCQNCGADPQTGVVPEWVQAHGAQFAEHGERLHPDEPGRSRFFAMPATLLGRVSAGLFLGVLAVFVASIIFDASGHDLPVTIGSVNVVLPIVVVAVCAMIVTGAVALIRYHERSWAVWVSTLLVVLVMGGEMVTALVPHSIPTVRPPSKTAYVVAYGDGFWFEVGGDVNAPTALGHDAGTPIPADYAVAIVNGWRGTSLDQFESEEHLIKLRIPEAGVDLSYDRGTDGRTDSKAYGGEAAHYDDYWVRLLLPITGFRPQSGSQVYASHWWVGLTDTDWELGLATNLTVDKKLPQGTYTVYYEEIIEGPMTGLDGVYDGQKTPYRATPGTNVTAPYTFTVGPPVASSGPDASSSPAVSTSPSAGGAKAAVSYARPPSPLPRANPASVCGWTFRPTVDIEVTELGCYDEDQDGLARSHRVGIFDARTERLLGSVHVGPGSTLDGAFRYEPLDEPVILKAGMSYLVGAETLGTGEPEKPSEVVYWVESPIKDLWAPEIAFGELRTDFGSRSTSRGFSVPTDPRPGLHMFMSPNFKFMPASASSPTP